MRLVETTRAELDLHTRRAPLAVLLTAVLSPHSMSQARVLVGALALLTTLLAPTAAHANGAFPFVSQLVGNPARPEQLVLRGNFGLIVSRDHGKSWDWLCEQGMGYQNVEPPLALLDSGVILLALPTGLSRSDESWCSFSMVDNAAANFVDVSAEHGTAKAAVALSVDLANLTSQVWESLDDGQTFTPLGPALTDFVATTLDVAASDSRLIYVSGTAKDGKGLLLRSDDHGASFSPHELPSSLLISTAPFISALDPQQGDTVYVRSDSAPGTLMVTRNGGRSFEEVLRLSAPVKAFALSPDGSTVLAATVGSGIYQVSTKTLEAEKVACTGVWCFTWTPDGVYACGDIVANGFLVAASPDDGRTFQSLVTPSCVRGPYACEAASSIGSVCPAAWPSQRSALGPNECVTSVPEPNQDCLAQVGAGGSGGAAATGGQGAVGGAAEAGEPAAEAGAAGSHAGTGAGTSSSGGLTASDPTAKPAIESKGCGCKLSKPVWRFEPLVALAIVLISGSARRRRRLSA